MLTELFIKDLVLIHNLHLNFTSGFSAFSGETGAGKSILLDALALSLGKRGDISLIRKTCDQTVISAIFNVSKEHPIIEDLSTLELLNVDDPLQISLRRHLNIKGASKAYINDIPVSVATLKQIGDQLLEIHGQFDHLFDSRKHRQLLDQSITDPLFKETLEKVAHIFNHYKDLKKQYQNLLEKEKKHQQNNFLNESILSDLSTIDLIENEEESLLKERETIEELGKAATFFEKAIALSENADFSKELRSLLSKVGNTELLEPLSSPLQRIQSDLCEVAEQARELFLKTKEAHARLYEIDERLYLLRSKAKKYGVDTSQLLPLLLKAQEHAQSDFDFEKSKLTKEIDTTLNEFKNASTFLTDFRLNACKHIEEEIQKEFQLLKLPHAKFKVMIQSGDDHQSIYGVDQVEFLIATNKEQDFSSIAKSASGGELSRVMLALKSILSKKTTLSTIVFDEIETGVGGAVATAIGHRMINLSHSLQVLSITHSPQVAALADTNYLVQKQLQDDATKTHVHILNQTEKKLEIARMISGECLTEGAIKAAEDLLPPRIN